MEVFKDVDAISDADLGDILNNDFIQPYKVKFFFANALVSKSTQEGKDIEFDILVQKYRTTVFRQLFEKPLDTESVSVDTVNKYFDKSIENATSKTKEIFKKFFLFPKKVQERFIDEFQEVLDNLEVSCDNIFKMIPVFYKKVVDEFQELDTSVGRGYEN